MGRLRSVGEIGRCADGEPGEPGPSHWAGSLRSGPSMTTDRSRRVRPLTEGRRLAQVIGATLLTGGLVRQRRRHRRRRRRRDTARAVSVVVDSRRTSTSYPDCAYPRGCNAGAGFLVGATLLRHTWRGGSAPAPLTPRARRCRASAGCTRRTCSTMQWASFGPQSCDGEAVGVSLAVKSANSPSFDPLDNQALLLDFAYCGVGGTSCEVASNTLSIVMPDYGVPAPTIDGVRVPGRRRHWRPACDRRSERLVLQRRHAGRERQEPERR